MMLMRGRSWVVMLASLSSSVAVFGADLAPPAWRGAEGSTLQTWSFITDANPIGPDSGWNSYGLPSAAISVGEPGVGWLYQLPGLGSATGFWDLGGADGGILIMVPDHDRTVGQTRICIQITCWRDISQIPIVQIPGASRESTTTLRVEHVSSGGDWMLQQSIWKLGSPSGAIAVLIPSDPSWGSVVDAVVVDTLPSTAPPSCPSLRYDSNADGMIDQMDLDAFNACSAGPAIAWPEGVGNCACFDQDGDQDVDQEDYGSFQRCYSGTAPADTACAL